MSRCPHTLDYLSRTKYLLAENPFFLFRTLQILSNSDPQVLLVYCSVTID